MAFTAYQSEQIHLSHRCLRLELSLVRSLVLQPPSFIIYLQKLPPFFPQATPKQPFALVTNGCIGRCRRLTSQLLLRRHLHPHPPSRPCRPSLQALPRAVALRGYPINSLQEPAVALRTLAPARTPGLQIHPAHPIASSTLLSTTCPRFLLRPVSPSLSAFTGRIFPVFCSCLLHSYRLG